MIYDIIDISVILDFMPNNVAVLRIQKTIALIFRFIFKHFECNLQPDYFFANLKYSNKLTINILFCVLVN